MPSSTFTKMSILLQFSFIHTPPFSSVIPNCNVSGSLNIDAANVLWAAFGLSCLLKNLGPLLEPALPIVKNLSLDQNAYTPIIPIGSDFGLCGKPLSMISYPSTTIGLPIVLLTSCINESISLISSIQYSPTFRYSEYYCIRIFKYLTE